ncbi:M35 family metallo-endopeptidase [Actinosynnema sp. NPDC050436]|uniref:M35 family metallo-endopeptidase n=1 Tax=Actinosynnema sp. NPDC050436 TaxID=3155659 RepID=UPI0033C9B361
MSTAVGAAIAVSLLVAGPLPALAGAPHHPVTSQQSPDKDAVSMAGQFSATLTAQPRYRLGEPIALTFDLHNATGRDHSVLEWNTPLENPDQEVLDYLRVSRDGGELGYAGRVIKRGDPEPSDYRLIRAGETLRSTIDVSTSFEITEPGTYTATLDTHLRDVIDRSADAPAARALGQFTRVDLGTASVTFEVVAGGTPRLPLSAALQPGDQTADRPHLADSPKDPKFVGGTASRREATEKAHKNAYKYADKSVGALPNPAPNPAPNRYITWFGKYQKDRYALARSHFVKIREHMEDTVITYDLEPAGCKSSVYAYVYPNQPTKIYLCGQFWKAPGTGTDSKAGTIVHEQSHFTVNGGTDDYKYGQDACKKLAKDDPDKAVMNADNHEYFAESISI